ncbi:MAG TPA: pantoate--beta-alanine ligase, partial [Chloroflexota bacterium]|nr:pantoate--beta-alanine ligase [Chloroflexota bacterium]
NVYLSPAERAQATSLKQALDLARDRILAGERGALDIEARMRREIERLAPLGRIDYVTIADPDTLQPIAGLIEGDALIALAVYFGSTRLIDNMRVVLEHGRPRFL